MRWDIFLGRFNFTLTYRPGSKNLASVLCRPARFHSWPNSVPQLHRGCSFLVCREVMLEALGSVFNPGGGPPITLFIPESIHSEFLQWGDSSRVVCECSAVACYPGRIRWNCDSSSGGHPWPVTPGSLSPPVLCVPMGRPLISPLRGSFTHCIHWSHIAFIFLRLHILFSFWSTMCSGSAAFPDTLSLIRALSSPPGYGVCSARLSAPR